MLYYDLSYKIKENIPKCKQNDNIFLFSAAKSKKWREKRVYYGKKILKMVKKQKNDGKYWRFVAEIK